MNKFLYYFLLGITILLLTTGIYISKDYGLDNFNGKIYQESKWTLDTGENSRKKEIDLPYSLKYEGDHNYMLTTQVDYLPGVNDSPYLFISMNHSYFKVFLDNKEIYSYTGENTPHFSKSPGNVYTAVPLPSDCTGQTLRIEIELTLEKGLTYVLSDIFFSDYATAMHHFFVADIFHNFMVVSILFIGLILIIISLSILRGSAGYDAFFIGFFAILFGMYSLTESIFNLYMLANPYLSYLINFIAFAAIPVPILAFYKKKVAPVFSTAYYIGISLLLMNIAGQIILHFIKIADIRQTLIFTHLLYFMSFILILISIMKSPKQQCANKKFLTALILPIIIGGAVDALIHYLFAGASIRNTEFSHMGVLITLLITSGYIEKNIMSAYQDNLNIRTYKMLAYRDGLTDVYNRTAYNDEILLISKNPNIYEDLICICVDINWLKQINDLNGHMAGDNIIRQTACILQESFSNYGKVFRIGGDEFNIFLYNLTEDNLKEILSEINEKVKKYNYSFEPSLSFSLGYELLRNVANQDIEACIKRADENMYAEKAKIKTVKRVR